MSLTLTVFSEPVAALGPLLVRIRRPLAQYYYLFLHTSTVPVKQRTKTLWEYRSFDGPGESAEGKPAIHSPATATITIYPGEWTRLHMQYAGLGVTAGAEIQN